MNKVVTRDNPDLLVANSLLSPTEDIKLTKRHWEPSWHSSASRSLVCSMNGAAFKTPPMPACSYMEEISSVTMLTAKRLVGVTPEINLREHVTCTPPTVARKIGVMSSKSFI